MESQRNLTVENDAELILMQALLKAKESADLAMKEKNELVAQLSHEIKTPLNAIFGFTEILKETVEDPTQRHYLNNIRNSGYTLLSAVNNALKFSKPVSCEIPSAASAPGAPRAVDAPADAAERIYVSASDKGAEKERILVVGDYAYDIAIIGASLKEAQKEWEEAVANGTAAAFKNVIFVVDDNENNLAVIVHLLSRDDIKVFPFRTGSDLLEAMQKAVPHMILLDILMPVMDGYEVCRRLKSAERTRKIPVIFLTSKTHPDDVVRGFQEGGVDYIMKPFGKDELLSRVKTHLNLYQTEQSLKLALADKEQLLNETLKGCVKVLIDILAMTNPDAFAQTLRVRNIAKKMAMRLGLSNAWEIEIGILLSHLGCAVIPSEIVTKRQAGEKLTSQETMLFNSHPKAAARFISNIPGLGQVAESIQNQFADYNPRTDPDIIKDFIRAVFDYDNLIQSGNTQQQAFDDMNIKAERYNPRVLGALEAEVRKLTEGYVVRTVPFEELKAGMVLADDIRNASNIILVRRNSELSEVLLEKLHNLRYCGRTYEPVKVLEQIT
jgi:response regulator RpfG family c-di-GMP phosphodiesterase